MTLHSLCAVCVFALQTSIGRAHGIFTSTGHIPFLREQCPKNFVYAISDICNVMCSVRGCALTLSGAPLGVSSEGQRRAKKSGDPLHPSTDDVRGGSAISLRATPLATNYWPKAPRGGGGGGGGGQG